MKFISALVLTLTLTGCAIVDTQKWEGKNEIFEGSGGAKTVEDGIDVWDVGSPPRKFKIIGVTSITVGDGWGASQMTRSYVATQVKEQKGDAAVSIQSSLSYAGTISTASAYPTGYGISGVGTTIAINNRKSQYYIIKYVLND